MNRIIEAFTRAHDQVTKIDELVMIAVTLAIAVFVFIIVTWIVIKLDK